MVRGILVTYELPWWLDGTVINLDQVTRHDPPIACAHPSLPPALATITSVPDGPDEAERRQPHHPLRHELEDTLTHMSSSILEPLHNLFETRSALFGRTLLHSHGLRIARGMFTRQSGV